MQINAWVKCMVIVNINMRDLLRGVYFIKVITCEGDTTKNLMKN